MGPPEHTLSLQVADFGGKMDVQPVYAIMAKSGNEWQYFAYVNPFKWVRDAVKWFLF